MTKMRFPVISTIVVAVAVAIMIGLGFWQLNRLQEKEAQLARLSANIHQPPISFPRLGPLDQRLLFRRSSVTCLSVADWDVVAGKAADGVTGFRFIAHCVTGAEGPGAHIVIGVGERPDLKPEWSGGRVKGWITLDGEESGLAAALTGHDSPRTALLVSDSGLAGLKAPAVPDVNSVPNNHLAYAVQWFLFAIMASVIFAILVWRRLRGSGHG